MVVEGKGCKEYLKNQLVLVSESSLDIQQLLPPLLLPFTGQMARPVSLIKSQDWLISLSTPNV